MTNIAHNHTEIAGVNDPSEAPRDGTQLDSYRIIRPEEISDFVECDVFAEGDAGEDRGRRVFFGDYKASKAARAHIPGVDSLVLSIYRNPSTRTRWRFDNGWNEENIRAGSIGIVGPGYPLEVEYLEQTAISLICLSTELLVGTAASAFEQDYRGLEAVNAIEATDQKLQALAELLIQELRSLGGGANLAVDSLASILSIHLIRHYHRNCRKSGLIYDNARLTRAQRARALDFIKAHISHNFGLRELAASAGMSETHFRACFKNTFGKSPHQFVLDRRTRIAIEQIRSTREALSRIAVITGFADQSHMTRMVKRVTGLTPGALRRA